jgi:hypothetical protein
MDGAAGGGGGAAGGGGADGGGAPTPASPTPAPADGGSSSDSSDSEQAVENQRWLPGLGWMEPLLCRPTFADWAPWSDGAGLPLPLPPAPAPAADGQAGWRLARSGDTDADGWRYGRSFARLATGVERSGGRAAKRASDSVRSRVWRRRAAYSAADEGARARAECWRARRRHRRHWPARCLLTPHHTTQPRRRPQSQAPSR